MPEAAAAAAGLDGGEDGEEGPGPEARERREGEKGEGGGGGGGPPELELKGREKWRGGGGGGGGGREEEAEVGVHAWHLKGCAKPPLYFKGFRAEIEESPRSEIGRAHV